MNGFTPGPWQTNCSHIYAPDGAILAVVHNPGSRPSDYPLVANRDLMAAAPDLFAALERVATEASLDSPDTWDQVEAALAKARGEQA